MNYNQLLKHRRRLMAARYYLKNTAFVMNSVFVIARLLPHTPYLNNHSRLRLELAVSSFLCQCPLTYVR